MQPAQHFLSGWCLGTFTLTHSRERLFCMLISVFPDVDGLGVILDERYYLEYHHVLAHNLWIGILISAILSQFSEKKFWAYCVYLASFHLHLFLDFLGSGPGWGIYYLWPVGPQYFANPLVWDLQSWQNTAFLVFYILLTMFFAAKQKRGPLEVIAPRLDAKFVQFSKKFF